MIAVVGIIYFEGIRSSGTQVILATEPVDPRSLLRGDYVILNYQISDPEGQLSFPKDENEIHVYTALSVDGS